MDPLTAIVLASLIAYDGDTFRYGNERFRVIGYDTPEINGKCVAERMLAVKGKDRLQELLHQGPVTIERSPKKDVYRRTLATVKIGGADVGQLLISEGLAVPIKTTRFKGWCKP